MHGRVVVDGVDVLSRSHDLDEPGVDRDSELAVEQPGSFEPDVLGLVHHGDDDQDPRLLGLAQRVQHLGPNESKVKSKIPLGGIFQNFNWNFPPFFSLGKNSGQLQSNCFLKT